MLHLKLKQNIKIASLFCLLFLQHFLHAQIISSSPIFPTRADNITFIYNATQGNAALTGISPIYAHTGVINQASASNSDWKNVQGTWGTADNRVLMNSLGNNLHSITFTPNSFYGLLTTDTIKKLAFVFRDAAGNTVGRDANGGDIYFNLWNDSLHAAFILPSANTTTAALNSSINLFCAASQNCNLQLSLNGTLLSQTNNDSLFYNNYTFTNFGNYQFILQATYNGHVAKDTLTVFVNPPISIQNPPAGTKDGINYLNDSTVILQLLAPQKSYVYALGEFNNWQVNAASYMHQTTDGLRYWIKVSGLVAQKEYAFQYLIDGNILVADPWADKILDPDNDNMIASQIYPNLKPYPVGKTTKIVSVLQTAQTPYTWTVPNFTKPSKNNLVIYELLTRDFVPLHFWNRMTDSLTYLKRLGINCIELMPVMEFEGNESWGYNPSFFTAPDKYYGPKNDLKKFVDACHQNGIAVLFDIALNHAFGQSPFVQMYWDEVNAQPAANSPWFNQQPTHPFNVGYDFNHESPYTKQLVDRVTRYWVQEFHADGYRFDLTKGFTQKYTGNDVGAWQAYDASRIALLERMVDSLRVVDASVITVFEHLSDNAEEMELCNHGILLWGNLNNSYNEATMGYVNTSDLSWGSYQQRGFSQPNLVTYMESHDEERLMYKNILYGNVSGSYSCKDTTTALKRMELAANLFLPIPGPKMMWQFGERGYDVSINKFCRICAKPMYWQYMADARRVHLFNVYAALIKLKLTYPTFATTNYSISLGGAVKRIKLNHTNFNAIALGNVDVNQATGYGSFHHTGWWYEYFTGDSINVSDVNVALSFKAGEYRLYTDKNIGKANLNPATGISEEVVEHKNLLVYPNPAKDKISFYVKDNQFIQSISLFNLQGQKVYETSTPIESEYTEININQFEKGIYFYEITVNNEIVRGKFLVE